MLEKVHEAAVHAVGMEAQLALDCPGMRQRTPVMIACHHGCAHSWCCLVASAELLSDAESGAMKLQ